MESNYEFGTVFAVLILTVKTGGFKSVDCFMGVLSSRPKTSDESWRFSLLYNPSNYTICNTILSHSYQLIPNGFASIPVLSMVTIEKVLLSLPVLMFVIG